MLFTLVGSCSIKNRTMLPIRRWPRSRLAWSVNGSASQPPYGSHMSTKPAVGSGLALPILR